MATAAVASRVETDVKALVDRVRRLEARLIYVETDQRKQFDNALDELRLQQRAIAARLGPSSSDADAADSGVRAADEVLERRLFDQLNSRLARSEVTLRRNVEDIGKSLRAQLDEQDKRIAEIRDACDAVRSMFESEASNMRAHVDQQHDAEVDLVRELTEDVAQKFAQTCQLIEASESRSAAKSAQLDDHIQRLTDDLASRLEDHAETARSALSECARLSQSYDLCEGDLTAIRADMTSLEERVQSTLTESSHSVDTTSRRIEVLSGSIASLEAELRRLQSQSGSAARSGDGASGDENAAALVRALRAQIDSQLEALRSSIVDIESDLPRLVHQQQDSMAQELAHLTMTVDTLQKITTETDDKMRVVTQRVDETFHDVTSNLSNIKELAAQLNVQLVTEITNFEEQLGDVSNFSQQTRTVLEQLISSSAEHCLESLEKTRGELLHVIKRVQDSHSAVTGKLEEEFGLMRGELDSELESMRLTSTAAQRQNDSFTTRMEELEQQVRVQVSEAVQRADHFQEQYKVAQTFLAEARDVTRRQVGLRQSLQSELTQVQSRMERHDRHASQMREHDEELETQLSEALNANRQLEAELRDMRQHRWYTCEHPDDPVDVAVSKTLQRLRLPFRVQLNRISPGLYMADRKISVSVANNQAVVRKGGGFTPLLDYLQETHRAILVATYGEEKAKQYLVS